MKKIAVSLALCLALALSPLSAAVSAGDAAPSSRSLVVNGTAVSCEGYEIEGSAYFRLRDIAYLLDGTGSQFSVSWDSEAGAVVLRTGEAYIADGTELEGEAVEAPDAVLSQRPLLIDGVSYTDIPVYAIGGSSFVRPQDLAEALHFGARYDPETDDVRVYSKGNPRVDAFDAWKAWIAANGGEEEDGRIVRRETRSAGTAALELSAAYNRTLDTLEFSCALPWASGAYSGAHTAVVSVFPDAQTVRTVYELRFDQREKPYLTGAAAVAPATLSPSGAYAFDSYEGKLPQAQAEQAAGNLLLLALHYADGVFPGEGDAHPMEAFGFVNLYQR